MSPGLTISLHWWRGCGGDIQRDLFWWRYRLGFLTFAIERQDLMVAVRNIRAAAQAALASVERRT